MRDLELVSSLDKLRPVIMSALNDMQFEGDAPPEAQSLFVHYYSLSAAPTSIANYSLSSRKAGPHVVAPVLHALRRSLRATSLTACVSSEPSSQTRLTFLPQPPQQLQRQLLQWHGQHRQQQQPRQQCTPLSICPAREGRMGQPPLLQCQ